MANRSNDQIFDGIIDSVSKLSTAKSVGWLLNRNAIWPLIDNIHSDLSELCDSLGFNLEYELENKDDVVEEHFKEKEIWDIV